MPAGWNGVVALFHQLFAPPLEANAAHEYTAESAIRVYLPVIHRPRYETPFGMEMIWFEKKNLDLASQSNSYWIRAPAFNWSVIEPELNSPRQFKWNKVDESGLIMAQSKSLNIIGTVKLTPDWAQKIAGRSCGPVAAETLDEFAGFLQALVERYSVAPYNIRYWQLGNEPDVDWRVVPADSLYGCWGDGDDDYFGGGYYAEMLKVAYPAIKRANPEAKVLVGGLLMDCDPNNRPEGRDCKSGKFFEGILHNQGGSFFDAVSFHGYAYYHQGMIWDETHPGWKARGGVVTGKINFLREVMSQYGIEKPILMTEASMLCPEWSTDCNPPGSAFFEAQSDYLISLYVRTWAAGIPAVIWYSLDDTGWRYASMTEGNKLVRPSYYAFQFMARELFEARIGTAIVDYPGIQGYEFIPNAGPYAGVRIWVLWSADGTEHSLPLPANTLKIYDKYGQAISPQAGQIVVKSPIFIEKKP